jgi:hypothetical protein
VPLNFWNSIWKDNIAIQLRVYFIPPEKGRMILKEIKKSDWKRGSSSRAAALQA